MVSTVQLLKLIQEHVTKQPFPLGLGHLEMQPENTAVSKYSVVKGHRALSCKVTFFPTEPAVLGAEVVFSRADKRLMMLFKASYTQCQPSQRERGCRGGG